MQHTPILLETANAAVEALAANPARTYLSVQNKSNAEAVVKLKVDGSNFIQAQDGVQVIGFSSAPTEGTFKLRLVDQTTAELDFEDDADAVEAALEALSNVGVGNVDVTGDFATGFTVEFKGALANTPMAALEVVEHDTLLDTGNQVEHVQVISFSHKPEAGTFRLLLGEAETPDLAFDASTATIKAQVNALGGAQVGSVSRDAGTGALTFNFAPGGVPTLAVTENTLTNNDAQASSVQKIYAAPVPASGAFKLMFGAETTAAIPYNATAEQVQDAIRDLPSVDEGNVAVAGDDLSAGFTVTFQAALAGQALPALIPTQNSLADAGGEECRVDVVQHTAGGDLSACEPTVALEAEGDPGAVTVTLEVTAVGGTQPNEGIELLAGETKEFRQPEVPLDKIYLVANVNNTPVEIVEG
jgi:hypothetical protein